MRDDSDKQACQKTTAWRDGEVSACGSCGRVLTDEDISGFFCATCREQLDLAPYTLNEFTLYLLIEMTQLPRYQTLTPDEQDAARHAIITASFDIMQNGADRDYAERRKRALRQHATRAVQTSTRAEEKRELRLRLEAIQRDHPDASKTQIAAALGINRRTLNRYLQRWRGDES